jgi:hypothetical protein
MALIVRKTIPPSPHANAINARENQPGTRHIQDDNELAAKRAPDGTIQLSLCLGFPRRPLSAGANRRYRPQAINAAHAFDRRPLFFKHLAAARFAEL